MTPTALPRRLVHAAIVLVGALAAHSAMANSPNAWSNFPIIIWHDQTPPRAAGLARLGVSGGRVFGVRGTLSVESVRQRVAPLLAVDWPFYVENIATDFYAAYHRYQPDHPVTWAYDQVRALAARAPDHPLVFQREPSLSDPRALAAIGARLAEHVALFGLYRPLYYSLGDETGIADLAAAWDFDLGADSLAQMREWLRLQYGTLAALNAQWGSGFATWDAVLPMTTQAAIAGPAGNFSAWTDFKTWMDEAFARAVRAGTDAVHGADPAALAGIEGAQIPGWGGYDYSRLAAAVDVMEIYDAGNNVEIARALNPLLITLATTTPGRPGENAGIWREVLRGARGLVVWDEAGVLVDDAGQPSQIGMVAGALYTELRDGVAAQLAASEPVRDAVAILYSPPSFRVSWLLDRRADGQDWRSRDAETEGQDSPLRASMREASAWLTHQGLQPRWISEAQLEAGTLNDGVRMLLLPRAIALSPASVAAIRGFADNGGMVLADGAPGQYDAHGRSRTAWPLQDIVTASPGWPRTAATAGLTAAARLSAADGQPAADIDMRVWRNGAVTLIGLQRDTDIPAAAAAIVVRLARPAQIYDMRRHVDLGWTDHVTLPVDAAEPAVLAISPARLPALVLRGPATARPGDGVELQIGFTLPSPAAAQVLRVDTLDPAGQPVAAYSGVVVVSGTAMATWRLNVAPDAPPGSWRLRVSDRLGDAVAAWDFTVARADQPD